MGKTGGTTGSNQYRVKGVSRIKDPSRLLLPVVQTKSLTIKQQRRLLEDHRCSPDTIIQLVASPDEVVRIKAARHPQCPPQALIVLAHDPVKNVRWHVAIRKDCPVEALEQLADDSGSDVVHCVAQNPSTSKAILHRLASHPHLWSALASNPACPPEILGQIASSKDYHVRCSVASNRQTSPPVLAKLLGDGSRQVRDCARFNPNLPDYIRVALTLGK